MINILTSILMPIFIQIIIGFIIQKKFKLDIKTLSRVQIYVLVPALIFIKFYTSELSGSFMLQIFGFTVLLFILLMVASTVGAKLLKMSKKKEKVFVNAVVLRNQGNYCIPLFTLLYLNTGNSIALSIHMIVLLTTNLLLNTVGLYNASSGSYSGKEAILKVFKLPMIYTIIFGVIFKSFGITVPIPILNTLEIMGNGVVALALITLGAQLAETKIAFGDKTIPIAAMMRLVLSPLLAFLLVILFGIEGTMAQVLIIGASAPTAVNSVLLAIEFDGDAAYASQTVFLTTLMSIVTVTTTIILVM